MLYKENKKITGLFKGDTEFFFVYHCDDLVWHKEGADKATIIGAPTIDNGDTAMYRIRYVLPDASIYQMTATNAASAVPAQDGKILYVTSKLDGSTPITINATVLRKNGTEVYDTKNVDVNFIPLIDEFTIADVIVTQNDNIVYMPFIFNPAPRADYSVTGVSLGQNQYVSVYSQTNNGIYIQRTGTIQSSSLETVSLSVELTDEIGVTHTTTSSIYIKYASSEYFEIKNSKSQNDLTVTFTLRYSGGYGTNYFDIYAAVDDINTQPYIDDYEHVVYDRSNMPETWVKTVPPGKSLYLYSDEMTGYCWDNHYLVSPGTITLSEDVDFGGNIMCLLKDNAFPDTLITARGAFEHMFANNTHITTTPQLPATTLKHDCYSNMFYGCTSLTSAPVLPALTMVDACYNGMFSGCTSLVSAPVLQATTLATRCYHGMFSGCTSLTSAPELPVTTLASYCYELMFTGCTSLTSAPELQATTLVQGCYQNMFSGCTSLNSVNVMFFDFDASNGYPYTNYWLQNVADYGTFYKRPGLNVPERGVATVPVNWNIVDASLHTIDISLNKHSINKSMYDTETLVATVVPSDSVDPVIWSTSDSSVATVTQNGRVECVNDGIAVITVTSGSHSDTCTVDVSTNWSESYLSFKPVADTNFKFTRAGLEYSINDGNWTSLPADTGTPTVGSSDIIRFRGNFNLTDTSIGTFSSTNNVQFDVVGNIMSLIYGDDFVGKTDTKNNRFASLFEDSRVRFTSSLILPMTEIKPYVCYSMFRRCYTLSSAPLLPATTVGAYGYCYMFEDCSSLTTPPSLPATSRLGAYCYDGMFISSGITVAPQLPSLLLAEGCYRGMFMNCPITSAPVLNAGTLYPYCYTSMFSLSDITTIPSLPQRVLAPYCYANMFGGCKNLVTVNASSLPSSDLEEGCYYEMFTDCTSLTSAPNLPATYIKVRSYARMFAGCTSLTNSPNIYHVTRLSDQCCQEMFMNCTSLTSASTPSATTLAYSCYEQMFSGCTSLASDPGLPATTLATACYFGMFYGCTSLEIAPILPATTLEPDCYQLMFAESGVNELEAHFDSFYDSSTGDIATTDWLKNVPNTGDFYKSANLTVTTRGSSTVPQGWSIHNA